jgi:hypothetical protein
MMTNLTKDDLRPNSLIQEGRNLYKVSTLYERYFTAQLLVPVPPRTTVVSLSYELAFHEPSARILAKYEATYGP